jgi:hypothetical protein
MLATVLDFSDFAIIALVVILFAGGSAYAYLSGADRARLRRLERKLDLILRHLNIPYIEPSHHDSLSLEVRELADNPGNKIEAIRLHREQTGCSLREAKDAVEAFMNRKRE